MQSYFKGWKAKIQAAKIMHFTFGFTIPGKRQWKKKRKPQIVFVREELWDEPSVVRDFWQTLLETIFYIIKVWESCSYKIFLDKYVSDFQKPASKRLSTKYDSSLLVLL